MERKLREAMVEALHRESEDLNERERTLRAAALEKLGDPEAGWITGFYDDFVVVDQDDDGFTKIPYTMGEDGVPVLGEPVAVTRTVSFDPISKESDGASAVEFLETGMLIEGGV